MKKNTCFSCGGLFPDIDGPTHRYMTSSAGCWSVYGEVLAREYSNPADVAKTDSTDEHIAMVKRWAQSAWDAWAIHHKTIRSWLPDNNEMAFSGK